MALASVVSEIGKKIGLIQPEIQDVGTDNKMVYADAIVSYIDDEYERRLKLRAPFDLQCQLNRNFLAGNQYCDINLTMNAVVEIPQLYWFQERKAYNQIAPIMETRQAKLGRINPSLKARPATSDREDVSSAKVTTAFLKGTYRRLNMHEKIKTATAWSEQDGTVFYKTIFDPEQGRVLGEMGGEVVHEGETDICVCPMNEILPDNILTNDVNKVRRIMHAKAYHVDDIERIWGVKVDGKEVDVFQMKQSNLTAPGIGYSGSVYQVISTKAKDHEIVKEEYELPSKEYPNGRLIIVAGSKLLHYGELPYRVGEDGTLGHIFTRQVCIERPGYFFGVSIIERLIPIQRAYNALINRINEYLNRCVMGVLVHEDGSIDIDTIRAEGIAPGSDIPYQSGQSPPKFLENDRLPNEFFIQLQNYENMFVTVSGVSTFSRQSAPPTGSGSGISLEIIKEQDDTRLSLTGENIRIAIVDVGKKWIRISKQFAKGPRMLRYVGNNNNVLVLDWEASDLTTDDVILETENELAQTPAQRKQQVFDMLDRKLFHDPETGRLSKSDRIKIFEMLEMGNWEAGDDVDEAHIQRAQRENLYLEQGQAPAIFTYDNHNIHMTEHLRYVLSSDFEQLTKENPMLAQIMVAHIDQHQEAIQATQAAAMSQLAQQQAAQKAQLGA